MIFSVYVPDTRGFFNIGDTAIFIVAVLLGPIVGAFAGGVGAALADLFLGFWYYAPATLVIKACEGVVVGILGNRKPQLRSKRMWKAFTLGLGLAIGVLLGGIGSIYYAGPMELGLGLPQLFSLNLAFFVPTEAWYLIGAMVAFLTSLTGFVVEPEFGWLAFATIMGGAIMVIGYFLYQYFFLFPLFGMEVVAVAEIPINIGQMLVGTVVALPVIKVLRRSFPQLKN
jgi:uncharacterized membrane protein